MSLSNNGRWTLAALVAIVALIVALWPRGDDGTGATAGPSATPVRTEAVADAGELADARAKANLPGCPQPGGSPAAGELTAITLECIGDGQPIDLAAALAGKPALLNVWAYWCAPCAVELPHLQEYAARAGSAINVMTVHSDPDELRALARLADLGVRLPGVQDSNKAVVDAIAAPNVLPLSVLIRADGTVATVIAKSFDSVDEISEAVRENLGVAA